MAEEKKLSEIIFGALSSEQMDDMLELEDEFKLWREEYDNLILGGGDDTKKPKK
jgi:hypothetical protein